MNYNELINKAYTVLFEPKKVPKFFEELPRTVELHNRIMHGVDDALVWLKNFVNKISAKMILFSIIVFGVALLLIFFII